MVTQKHILHKTLWPSPPPAGAEQTQWLGPHLVTLVKDAGIFPQGNRDAFLPLL